MTDELERRAAELLDPAVYAFFAAGAGDERALAANAGAAFEAQTLRPRALVDVSERTTATHVLGKEVGLPVLVAPVGFQTLLHPDGELATVRRGGAPPDGRLHVRGLRGRARGARGSCAGGAAGRSSTG